MSNKKKYRFYLEVSDDWIDIESPGLFASMTIRDDMLYALKTSAIELLTKKMKLPKIKIPKEELRKAVKDRMVDEIIRKSKENNEF